MGSVSVECVPSPPSCSMDHAAPAPPSIQPLLPPPGVALAPEQRHATPISEDVTVLTFGGVALVLRSQLTPVEAGHPCEALGCSPTPLAHPPFSCLSTVYFLWGPTSSVAASRTLHSRLQMWCNWVSLESEQSPVEQTEPPAKD